MTCIEEAAIRQITPLISIVKLAYGNIGSKGNTTCMWNESKLSTILPNLPSKCQYFVLSFKSKQKSDIILKSTKYNRRKIQKCLELLSQTVDDVWKNTTKFNLTISQENLNEWPESGDIRNLDDIITIPIPEDIVQKDNDELKNIEISTDIHGNKAKTYNLFKDGNDSGPSPLQNKDFPEEMFEAAINTSNAGTTSVHDALKAHKELEELMSQNESTVKLKQNEAIPLTEFADMNKTRFAWARAFPTIFQPEYIDGKWTIRHDITGSVTVRERNVNQNDWMIYLMWRSDGLPTSHPTFALVLYNHKVRNQLQKLGSVCLNSENINPYTTVDDLKLLWANDDDRKKLQKKLFTFASNVPGTKPYWVSKRHEFKSTSFFHSYINKMHPTIFHTGSIAEYHDSWLRILLSQYVSCIDGNTKDDGDLVLSDNKHFQSAVQKYKHVVTNFLASKMEIWYNIVMKNVHNVVSTMITKEFASSRGAIHYHSLNYTDQSTSEEIDADKCLVNLSIALYTLFIDLDKFIDTQWTYNNDFKKSPSKLIHGKEAYKIRELFLLSFDVGKSYWENFKLEELKLYDQYSLELGNIYESNWGYGAMHPGTFPTDWVKPSGMEEDGYCKTDPTMLSSMDVLESGELKKLKINREYDLLNRSVNYYNHCGTHKCSGYCSVISIMKVLYNKEKHQHVKDADIVIENNKTYVKLKISNCRMNFGKQRIFDSSGENNLTRGIPIRLFSKIICDTNGQPRYHSRRNHPRILAEPHSFLYFGGYNDTQRLLSNRTGYETCMKKGIDYEDFIIKLNIHGCAGLEQYTASHLLEDYVTKYNTKGGVNSDNWNVPFKSIIKDYTDSGNSDKTARSVYAKYMNEIIKLVSKTQDECVYLLSGGLLSTNTVQTKKCSVNTIDLKKITRTSETDKNDIKSINEFTWKNILYRYKNRSKNMSNLNLYKYTSSCFYKDKVIHPQFFGFKISNDYPPGETYSKLMLTIYKPWIKNVDEFLDQNVCIPKDSFSNHLCRYMWDKEFPKSIMMHILRSKIALDFHHTEERNFGLEHEHSPTINRKNEIMAGVDEIDCEPINNLVQNDHMDLGEEHFLKLNDGGPDFDWSEGYDINHNYNFLASLSLKIKNSIDVNSKMLLIEENIYNPENTITESQKIIIFNHIYQHYKFHISKDKHECPVSMTVKIQGLPGTGKTFIANTIRNIDINLDPMYLSYTCCAPTGCAASLINGTTHHQLFNIPIGKKFHLSPTDWNEKNASLILDKHKYWKNVFTLLMDEDSMVGRPFWGWFKHRLEEFRKIKLKVDEDYNAQTLSNDKYTELTKRIFGGIPAFYSMGDVNQLPPVAMKSIADDCLPKSSCSADAIGTIAFSEFMDPPNQSETVNFTFHMTDVVRQKDKDFKKVLSLMRTGTLNSDSCDYLINRSLSKIKKKRIFDEAIHLVTQWKHSIDPTIEYLNMLGTPVAKIIPQYSSFLLNKGVNHCIKECNFPKLTALNVGCKVMLLKNSPHEYKLVNGSIGIVKKIIFENRNGPRNIPYELPACIIVEFKESNFSDENKWRTDVHKKLIPVAPITILCERKCCTVISIPLRVCKAITIHKAQGMSIGPQKAFESAIISLPEKGERTTPGSELTAFSRATDILALAICDTNRQITIETIKNIGTGSSYNKRKLFDKLLLNKDTISRAIVKRNITKLHVVENNKNQTFLGGCDFLLEWYLNRVKELNPR